MKSREYDFHSAIKLENYVRNRYRNQLSNGALSFYVTALPLLERSGFGLCHPITADYRKLADAGFKDMSGLKKVLSALSGVLCEVEIGAPIKGGKKATRLRRYNLRELMKGEPLRRLIDYHPADAKQLAEILATRTFVYGNKTDCRPYWNISKSGGLYSAKPDVQKDPEVKRAENLCAGLDAGEVLLYADFKAAHPSIIQIAIGYRFESDPYQLAADLLEIDRDSAKRKVNGLAYMPDSEIGLTFWKHPKAEAVFMPYAKALTAYKEKLWAIGKPRNKKRRFVNTLLGHKIEADRGDPPHRGRILAWQIQGTIAEILNTICLKIIVQEDSKHWKLCFPEHDAVYVIGKPEHAEALQVLMESEAAGANLPLTVKVPTFEKRDVV